MALAIETTAAGAVLRVRVKPQAPRAGLQGEHGDGSLKVSVRAAPERGKANDEVIEVLAKVLGVRRASLSLVSGETSRSKRVLVEGLTADAVREKLRGESTG